ncbi:hypothetical protein DMB66_15435 [Actinoplanes sp. ATCC 53533]|uniref:serine/threonine-protein kinase n=1 Tax=Actinoplanes sp. ATCC 53533 TaxID=1288362 RepID=UPI000F7B8EAA|nr:serine/threonine-protein kinase [Actinoplanes sp. ATCC 53533]RSM67614.1 hypothetical protein DMB66_15435 [Actinoplanes sp. ATCC 53533]
MAGRGGRQARVVQSDLSVVRSAGGRCAAITGTGLPQVGGEFGDYRIDAEIGRGGMGVVYRAWQSRMNRPVALKVLPQDMAQDPAYRGRFGREAAALAQLDSPHVTQIYDHGEIHGNLYLAMQLVQGPDLGRLVAGGPLLPRRALRITDQVAGALGDGHAVGVVHRDVKPSNVLCRPRSLHDEDDFVYLCDFGIARSIAEPAGQATETGDVVGTVAYLAPERFDGRPATPASDVYSLGCMLWTLLTGAPPFVGTQAQMIMGHAAGPVPRLEGSDPRTGELNRLLAGLLAKDPVQRPTIAEARRQIRQILAMPAKDAMVRPGLVAAPATGTGAGSLGSVPSSAGETVPLEGDTRPAGGGQPEPVAPTARWTGVLPWSAGEPGGRSVGRRSVLVAGGVAAAVLFGGGAWLLLDDRGPSPAERLTAATPAGLTCRNVELADADRQAGAQAGRDCELADASAGSLRLMALSGPGTVAGYLRHLGGPDPSALPSGTCPDHVPAQEQWSRGSRSGTLYCFVTAENLRYAWTVDDDVLTVLDGDPDRAYPADVNGVRRTFDALSYPG